MRHRPRELAAWLLIATVFLAACGGSGTTSGSAAISVPASAITATSMVAREATAVPVATAALRASCTIVGMVTYRASGAPLAGVYIVVGY